MTIMISQALTTDGAWTLISAGPIANILISGPANGWSVCVAASQPNANVGGMPITSPDGAWSSSVLAAGEGVYARPFGQYAGRAIVISGMKN